MCHAVKIVNLLDEFFLVYSESNGVSEYILELVNKFAINACFSSHCFASSSLTLAVCANFEIAA